MEKSFWHHCLPGSQTSASLPSWAMWPHLPQCDSPVSCRENSQCAQGCGVHVPQSRLPWVVGVLSDIPAPLQLLSRPRSQKGFPDGGKAVRVLDSACLGAYSPGLSKVYRLMGGASQHSPGAQISCVHHFLAAWPR